MQRCVALFGTTRTNKLQDYHPLQLHTYRYIGLLCRALGWLSGFFPCLFTSEDCGSNPTSDWSLACGVGFQSLYLTAWGDPPTCETDMSSTSSLHRNLQANGSQCQALWGYLGFMTRKIQIISSHSHVWLIRRSNTDHKEFIKVTHYFMKSGFKDPVCQRCFWRYPIIQMKPHK